MTSLKLWRVAPLQRVYPLTMPPRNLRDGGTASLDLALNGRGSVQVAMRHDDPIPRRLTVDACCSSGLQVRIRRVGYVPVRNHTTDVPYEPAELDGIGMTPGLAPDPLFDETSILLAPHETHAFWLTISANRGVEPGRHEIRLAVSPDAGRGQSLRFAVNIHPVAIKPRRRFPVIQWFYVDALLDAHACEAFDQRFWKILPAYFKNLSEHGQDTVYAPVFTPPLDGVKRPSQLLHVTRTGKRGYRFDWRDVKRYVDLAKRQGIRHFEWTHFFTQWGAEHAIRIYHGQGRDERLLWPASTGAVAPAYRHFLAAFLPEFERFLKSEKLLKRSFFHVSDEPHGDAHRANYRRARALLSELAPWMQVMDALSEIEFGRGHLTDFPIASIATALDFVREGIPGGCYYCCGPRGRFLNRFIDTPLPKIAMNGWLFYRWPFKAFLHWGYNYWYRRQTRELIDPYNVNDAHAWPGWTAGDPFLVYPGKAGPVDSLRWEIFAESLSDYALLQTLDIARDDSLLRPLRSFEDFPKTRQWVPAARRRLLQRAARRNG